MVGGVARRFRDPGERLDIVAGEAAALVDALLERVRALQAEDAIG